MLRASHAVSPLHAEARFGEEMFVNGYALITWEWAFTTIPTARFSAQHSF